MPSEAAPSAEARFSLAPAPDAACVGAGDHGAGDDAGADRRDGFWVALIGSVDTMLRAFHGIAEFTDDPACVLRLGLTAARERVTLGDGTVIEASEAVGSLHLWNEHLPRYSTGGPDLAWAGEMRRRVLHSLRLLGDFVAHEPEWQNVRAFCGDATLSRRLGDTQIRRIAERYGFERVALPASLLRQLHYIGDCFNAWALARAFNPVALERQTFLRQPSALWISRPALLDRYGDRPRRVTDGTASERSA